jgi:hypothetical protein
MKGEREKAFKYERMKKEEAKGKPEVNKSNIGTYKREKAKCA